MIIQWCVQAFSLILFCICLYKIMKVAWGFTFYQESKPVDAVVMSKKEYLKLFYLAIGLYALTMGLAIVVVAVINKGMYITPLSFYNVLRDTFTKGDGLHYMHIAKYGYVTEGLAKNWIAFYPLFPLLVAIVRGVVRSYYLSSIIINFICTYISLIFMYKWIVAETGNRKYGFRAALLLVAAPQSLFYVAPYGEALYFALTLIAVYSIRRGKFLTGAIFGFISALTRNVGIILAAVFVLEYLNQHLTTIKKENSWVPHVTKSVAMTLFILSGQLVYMGLNWYIHGNPNAYSIFQMDYWEQGIGNFVSTIGYLMAYVVDTSRMEWILSLPSIGAFFFYLFWMYKKGDKIRPSHSFYALCYFFVIFAPTRLLSGLRYSMVAFPLYLMICDIEDKWYYVVLTMFAFWWLFFVVVFARGFYVF